MKIFYSTYILLLLFNSFSVSLQAQGHREKFATGSFEVVFMANIPKGSSSSTFFSVNDKETLDFSGVNSGELQVIIKDIQTVNHSSIYIKPVWVNEPIILKKVTNRPIELTETNNSGQSTRIRFLVLKDGTAEIVIKYAIRKDGQTETGLASEGEIRKTITVVGLEKKSETPTTPTNGNTDPIKPIEKDPVTNDQAKQPVTDNSTDEKQEPTVTTPKKNEKKTPPPSNAKKDEDKNFWENTQKQVGETSSKEEKIKLYDAFIDKFPSSKFVEKATEEREKLIDISFAETKDNSEKGKIIVSIAHTFKPYIKNVSAPSGIVFVDSANTLKDNKLIIKIIDDSLHIIDIADAWGKQASMQLSGNPLSASVEDKRTDDGSIVFRLGGGTGKGYVIEIVKDGLSYASWEKDLGTDTIYTMTQKDWANLNGSFSVTIRDSRRSAGYEIPQKIVFETTKGISTLIWLLLAAVGIVAAWLVWYLVRKRKRAELEKKRIENKLQTKEERKQKATNTNTKNVPNLQEERNVEAPQNISNEPNANFKITKREMDAAVEVTKDNFERTILVENFSKIDMSSLWSNTAIQAIYLHQNVLDDIDSFVRKENEDSFSPDGQENVPEIGGFLLGRFYYDKKINQYHILVEKFVAATPEDNDRYKVEFGTKAWTALDNMREDNPGTETVGWFHTHPGHSLFLSQPDLKIQEGFFKQLFQFAMEIDPLTQGMDTGFFVRTKNGVINNTRELRPNAKWYKWEDICKYKK